MKTELKTDVCPACATKVPPNVVDAQTTQSFRGDQLKVITPVTVCRDCGFQFLGKGQLDELRRRTADVYRKKHRLLTSMDIVLRRNALRETQEQFAKRLNVGVASVKRWETWLVQDKRSDELIRDKTDCDLFAQRLAKVMRSVGKTSALETACSKIIEGEQKFTEGIEQLVERLATATDTCWRELLMSPPNLDRLSDTWTGRETKAAVFRFGANQAERPCFISYSFIDSLGISWADTPSRDLRKRFKIAFKVLVPDQNRVQSSRVKFKDEPDVVSAAA